MSALQETLKHTSDKHGIKDLFPFRLNGRSSGKGGKQLPSDAFPELTKVQKARLHATYQPIKKDIASSLNLQQKMSRRKAIQALVLGGVGTAFVFSKVLIDRSEVFGEKKEGLNTSENTEIKKLLPNPLEKFSFSDGSAFMIELDAFENHVYGLPYDTGVVIGRSDPDPGKQDSYISSPLFSMTSGKNNLKPLDKSITVISGEQDSKSYIVFHSYNYNPHTPTRVTYQRSDNVPFESLDFAPNFDKISKQHEVYAEHRSSEDTIAMSKALSKIVNLSTIPLERFSQFRNDALLILHELPANAKDSDYTYIPGIGIALKQTVAKQPDDRILDAVYGALGQEFFYEMSLKQKDGMDQYRRLHESLVKNVKQVSAIPGQHQNVFEMLDAINKRQTSFLALPQNFKNEQLVYEEAFRAIFMHTDAVIARFKYGSPCYNEQDNATRANLTLLLQSTLSNLQSISSEKKDIEALFLNIDRVLSSLLSAGILNVDYIKRIKNTTAATRYPTSTPNPYYSPTPEKVGLGNDTRGISIWGSKPTQTPTPTRTPLPTRTTSPTQTPTPTRTPTPTPASIGKDHDSESGMFVGEAPFSTQTPTPTSTPTPGPSLADMCKA